MQLDQMLYENYIILAMDDAGRKVLVLAPIGKVQLRSRAPENDHLGPYDTIEKEWDPDPDSDEYVQMETTWWFETAAREAVGMKAQEAQEGKTDEKAQ